MEWTGKVQNITKDYETNKWQITLSVNEPSAMNSVHEIKSCERLSIKAEPYKKKRSLDANAYAWVLFTKIANAISTNGAVISKDDVYEEMLQKYGVLHQDEDGYITVTVREDVDMSKIQGHWKFYKGNGKFSSYLMIKGSSEYNTAEMAKFIDAVVQEAKELGIETLPPAELERMVSLWQNG